MSVVVVVKAGTISITTTAAAVPFGIYSADS
jgi:hypothetical protein